MLFSPLNNVLYFFLLMAANYFCISRAFALLKFNSIKNIRMQIDAYNTGLKGSPLDFGSLS